MHLRIGRIFCCIWVSSGIWIAKEILPLAKEYTGCVAEVLGRQTAIIQMMDQQRKVCCHIMRITIIIGLAKIAGVQIGLFKFDREDSDVFEPVWAISYCAILYAWAYAWSTRVNFALFTSSRRCLVIVRAVIGRTSRNFAQASAGIQIQGKF